jgi:hypothetical protein
MSRPADPPNSREKPVGGSSTYVTGVERRTFIVLCHFDNGASRRMIRHVFASSVEDILDSIHAEFRRACVLPVRYYSSDAMSYVPLAQRDWAKLPKCLELQIEFDRNDDVPEADDKHPQSSPSASVAEGKKKPSDAWKQFTTADGSRSSSVSAATPTMPVASSSAADGGTDFGTEPLSLKSKVVKYLRKQLLPLYNDGQITREEVIVICSAVAYDYASTLVDSVTSVEETMNAVSRAPLSRVVQDQLQSLLEKYVVGGVSVGDASDDRNELIQPAAAAMSLPSAVQSERGSTAGSRIQKEALAKAKQKLATAAQPEAERTKKARHYESRDGALKGFYEAPASLSRADADERTAPTFRGGETPRGRNESKFRNDRQEYYDSVALVRNGSPSSGSRRQPYAAAAAATLEMLNTPSIFKAVHYTVSGRFPAAPSIGPEGASARKASPLEVSLTSPNLTSAEHDIVIIGSIQCKSQVSLTWWLAYGAHRHVLDMDNLYLHRCVSTYQVSPNGFILTIRSGALVEGWDYYVHLTVTADLLGTQTSAQTSFHLQSSFRKMTALETFAHQQKHQTSGMNNFTSGYYGDEEFGALSPEPPHRIPPAQATDPTSESPPPSGGTASSAWRTRTPPPQQPQHRTYLGMTFQEQLRAFFVEQIEPLYFVCENPNLPHTEFKAIVKEVAKKHWFSRPPDSKLEDTQRREIVLMVKSTLLRRRMEVDQSQQTSTYIPNLSMRPNYAPIVQR